jgi:hypothetical protein
MPYEIPDFQVAGRETCPVTVIARREAREFFNCRERTELTRHLRGLRDLGILVHERDRLSQRVRIGPRESVRAYVCRGRPSDIPRRKRRRRVRVLT